MTQTLSTLWKGQLVLIVVLSAVGLVLSGLLALSDLESRDEMFDGLGLFLGLLFAGLALALAVPAALALGLYRRRPTAGMAVALVLGVVLVVAGVLLTASVGSLPALCCLAVGGALAATSGYLLKHTGESSDARRATG